MKKLVQKFSPEAWASMMVLCFAVLALVMPEIAFAGKPDIKGIVSDGTFKDIVTLGFGLFAFWKWIEYIAGFSPSSALKDMIVPALITFLAFKWTMVLGWFKLV